MYYLKYTLVFGLVLVCSLAFADISQVWFGNFGGLDNEEGQASCFDSSGNFYLAGNFRGTFSAGTTTLTSGIHTVVFVIKFSPGGEVLWARQSTNTGSSSRSATLTGITVDNSQNVFLCGYFFTAMKFSTITLTSAGSDDIFVACFDSSGNTQWAISSGGTASDRANSISIGSDGKPVLTGFFSTGINLFGTDITNSGGADIFVAKLNNNATLAMQNHWGGSSTDYGIDIISIPDGGYAICGYYTGSITFGANSLTNGGKEAYICKLDASLNPVWARGSAGDGLQESTAVSANANGIIWLGQYSNTTSFGAATLPNVGTALFAVKLDNTGNYLWANSLGVCSNAGTIIKDAYLDTQDQVYCAGTLIGTNTYQDGILSSAGSSDAMMFKLNASGNHLWAYSFGGSGIDTGTSIRGNESGNFILSGTFSAGAVIGNNSPVCAGNKDLYGFMFSEGDPNTPAVPQNLSIIQQTNALVLSWDAVSTSETGTPLSVTGYRIYYSPTLPDADYQLLGTSTTPSFMISGSALIPDVQFFRVKAYH